MWYNVIMRWMLNSPLHGLLSKSTMLIRFKGRKTGKDYQTPVNYYPEDGELYVASLRKRTWWRNLRGGAKVWLRLRGRDREATGTAIEDPGEVAAKLGAILGRLPQQARYFGVSLDEQGRPRREEVMAAAEDRVVVRVRLQDE